MTAQLGSSQDELIETQCLKVGLDADLRVQLYDKYINMKNENQALKSQVKKMKQIISHYVAPDQLAGYNQWIRLDPGEELPALPVPLPAALPVASSPVVKQSTRSNVSSITINNIGYMYNSSLQQAVDVDGVNNPQALPQRESIPLPGRALPGLPPAQLALPPASASSNQRPALPPAAHNANDHASVNAPGGFPIPAHLNQKARTYWMKIGRMSSAQYGM
jgi:hypothetical protein